MNRGRACVGACSPRYHRPCIPIAGRVRASPRAQVGHAPAVDDSHIRYSDAEHLLGSASNDPDQIDRCRAAAEDFNLVPFFRRIASDQLSPVTAYRALVGEEDHEVPSFLFESVQNGVDSARFSFVGARPTCEILARGKEVTLLDHKRGTRETKTMEDPLSLAVESSRSWRPAQLPGLPAAFTGGWVGYTGYDTVRYTYPAKIPFSKAPEDDRGLLDMHLALYMDAIVFDNATKIIYVISWAQMEEGGYGDNAIYEAVKRVDALVKRLTSSCATLLPATIDLDTTKPPRAPQRCNMTKAAFMDAVETTREHIRAGDIFQLVLSHRFERQTYAAPFDVYRALRIVNPSPYMVYMQARSCILVAASPEILCRVGSDRTVTNRPLAGTRRRGATRDEDCALEAELLADEKERAEHTMLVDLGRNDVGRVAVPGSVRVEALMDVERYSHVMHISSTVVGTLRPELDAWDALRAALPVGTISGAPKVRAMQIIDELETNRRGPYGGGFGYVSFSGGMDMALALRTMVVPTNAPALHFDSQRGHRARRLWDVHIQAGAGIVADSDPESEFQETVAKSNAMSRAVDLAERSFTPELP